MSPCNSGETRKQRGAGFKNSVSVEAILELECRYAEAETKMMDESLSRVLRLGAVHDSRPSRRI
jgi:hypothetical protein